MDIIKRESIIKISYNENLTLSELSNILDAISKTMNEINRNEGVATKNIKKYEPIVQSVANGSIDILLEYFLPATITILSEVFCILLKNKLEEKGFNEEINKTFDFKIGKFLEIHIHKNVKREK